MSEATLEEGAVVCPWHGSRYALENGAVLDGSSAHPQVCFDARVSGSGIIEVRTPEDHS